MFTHLYTWSWRKLFQRITIRTILEDQLYEAERAAIEHRAAAEHHKALADMYAKRALRVRSEMSAHHAK